MPKQDVSVAKHFADPRIDRTKKHPLGDILVIAPCAVICGADAREEVEAFGEAKADWLKGLLALPNGIPSHDTFYRVFSRLDPQKFGGCVADGMGAVCQTAGLKHIAVDGKAVRSAPRNTFRGCLHLVSAWAAENRLILGQQAVADGSHETAAIPELLEVLDRHGALVASDAAGCQKEIARQVRDRGGDYLLAVKGNQPTLQDAVHAVFDRACETDLAGVKRDGHEAAAGGHGRHGERYVTVIYEPKGLPSEWPDVAAVVLVGREREVNGTRSGTAHDDITSPRGTAAAPGELIRRHWSVETEWHGCPGAAFREDANTTAAGHAGADLGLVRRVAASLLQQDTGKGSIKAKRLMAALDENDLLQALQGFVED